MATIRGQTGAEPLDESPCDDNEDLEVTDKDSESRAPLEALSENDR